MDIRVTEKASNELDKMNAKNLKIVLQGYGWSGPYFGLAQGEPQADDITTVVGDRTFLVEKEIADIVKFFEIDYYKGWLQKGFVVYANGSRGAC